MLTRWDLPLRHHRVETETRFLLICATVVPLLLLPYRRAVRYTFVGTLLDGPRNCGADDTQRAALQAHELATASESS